VPALRFSRPLPGCYFLLFVFSISTFPLLNVNLAYTRDFLVSHPNMPLTPNYWHPPIHRHRAILTPTNATSVPSSHTCDVISWNCHLRRYIVDDTCGVTSRRRDTCPMPVRMVTLVPLFYYFLLQARVATYLNASLGGSCYFVNSRFTASVHIHPSRLLHSQVRASIRAPFDTIYFIVSFRGV
jgi:hypothetical protein